MTTAQRVLKQMFILLILLVVLGGLSFFGYTRVTTRPIPTPDPVTQLTAVQVIESRLIKVGENDYDFWAKVRNPNTEYGSEHVAFDVQLLDAQNKPAGLVTGSFYILPGQTRSIIESSLKFTGSIARADMSIKSIEWQKVSPLFTGGISLLPQGLAYEAVPQAAAAASVAGEILNNSDFDLNSVEVIVMVRDRNNVLVGVNKTNIMTFLSGTERGFRVNWPQPVIQEADPQSVILTAEAYSNIFSNSNFIQRFVEPERFQNYY